MNDSENSDFGDDEPPSDNEEFYSRRDSSTRASSSLTQSNPILEDTLYEIDDDISRVLDGILKIDRSKKTNEPVNNDPIKDHLTFYDNRPYLLDVSNKPQLTSYQPLERSNKDMLDIVNKVVNTSKYRDLSNDSLAV